VNGHVAAGLKPASRNVYLRHLRGFFKWAARRGLVALDPAAELIAPKVAQGVPHPLSEDELQLALVTAGQPLRTWIALGAFCGLRAGEIARLRREDVLDDRTPPLLHVADGKGGRQRLLPLPETVLAELRLHFTTAAGPLWPNRSPSISGHIGRHLRSLGIPHPAHSLRHRFATQVYRRSRDLLLTQALLGHASVSTTQIYAAHDPQLATQTVNDLGADLLRAAPVILPEQSQGGAE
jgi:integrase/recombinase XerC